MEVILKKRLGETVALELRSRLEKGDITGVLPGVRLLAKTLGVSVPTVLRALRQLEVDGVLEGGGARRRWRVRKVRTKARDKASLESSTTAVGGTGAQQRQKRLLFITTHPLSGERGSGVQVFAELFGLMDPRGWEVMHRVEDFGLAKKPRKSWSELMRLTTPDAVVALGGTPILATWMKEKRIRTLFLGGDPGKSGVPCVAIRITTMLKYALDRLLASGHRSILLPLCRRGQLVITHCRKTANESADAARVERDCVVIAESNYASPDVMMDLLRRQWLRRAPDALVFFDSREFLAASSYIHKMGVEIPRDLSVIILSHNAIMDWHVPAISHFEHPARLMARTVAKWVTEGQLTYSSEPLTEIRARWVEGGSVIDRK